MAVNHFIIKEKSQFFMITLAVFLGLTNILGLSLSLWLKSVYCLKTLSPTMWNFPKKCHNK